MLPNAMLNAWFRYCLPMVFLGVALARRGTVESAVYFCMVFLAVFLDARPRQIGMHSRLRRGLAVLAVLSAGVAIAASIVAYLCSRGALGESRFVIGILGLAGVGSKGASPPCGSPAPEAVAAAASLLSWGLGRVSSRCPPWRWTPLGEAGRFAQLGVLLVVGAALDCNVFGAACELAGAALALGCGVASSSKVGVLPSAALRLLKAFLMVASLLQLLTVLLLEVSLPGVDVPEWVLRLLGVGAELHAARQVQFVVAGLLAQVLHWSTATTPAPPPVIETILEVRSPLSEVKSPHSRPSIQESSRTGSCARESASPTAQGTRRRRKSRAGAAGAAGATSREGSGASLEPVGQPAVAHTTSRRTVDTTRTARSVRRERSPQSAAATKRTQRVVRQDSFQVKVKRSMAHFFDTAITALCLWGVLPSVALIAWPVAWPALATLPMLAVGLLLVHEPRSSPLLPVCLYSAALSYQVACTVVLYLYNVAYNATGESHAATPFTYMWMQRWGLQTYLGNDDLLAPRMQQLFQVASQAMTVACFVVAARAAREARLEQRPLERTVSNSNLLKTLIARHMLLLLRPVTLFTLATVVLQPDGTNLFGLGCVLWTLALAAIGVTRPYVHAGWDPLRANSITWYALMWYCGAVAAVLFCWQILGDGVTIPGGWEELVGLARSEDGRTEKTWQWLCLAAMSAAQARGLRAGVAQPKAFLVPGPISVTVRVVGIFGHMAILFLIVMLPPPSAASFVFLVFFVGIVAVQQFNPSSPWRSRLLVLTGFFAAMVLPLHYATLIPQVLAWIAERVPHKDYPKLWNFLALDSNETDNVKVCMTACAMFMAGMLYRNFQVYQQRENLLNDIKRSNWNEQYPVICRVLWEIKRWSTSLLLFAAYLVLLTPGVISRVYAVMLVVLLFKGNYWQHAGAMISLCSAALLMTQFFFRFEVALLTEEQQRYWGVEWKPNLLARQVSLLLIGIAQHSVKRLAVYCRKQGQGLPRWTVVSGSGRRIRREVRAYGAHIGATLLFCVALFRNTAWSILYVTLVLIFRFRSDGARKLPNQTLAWLWVMAFPLGVNLVYRLAVEVWFPPDTIARPDEHIFADNWVCLPFNGDLRMCATGGEECSDDELLTQRQRCGEAWVRWLGGQIISNGKLDSADVFLFLVFFPICVVRHLCIKELELEHRVGAESCVSSLPTADLPTPSDDEQDTPGEAISRQRAANARTPRSAGAGAVQLAPLEIPKDDRDDVSPRSCRGSSHSRAGTSVASVLRSARTRVRDQAKHVPDLVYWTGAVLMWLSLLGLLVTDRPCLISLVYTVLFLQHLFTVENSHVLTDPFQARERVLAYIRTFNLLVIVFSVLCQCPSVPCAYELSLGPDSALTRFTSPSQCVSLQEKGETLRQATEMGTWLSFGLQSIGFEKVEPGLSSDMYRFWNLAIFVAGLVQTTASSRWKQELIASLEARRVSLRMRRDRYEEYLSCWRQLELTRIDTKHEVLMTKLEKLGMYLRKLRAVWARENEAITEVEKLERKRVDRVLDLCIQTGVPEEDMNDTLQEFSTEDGSLHEANEARVLEYIKDKDLLELGAIDETEFDERRAKLLMVEQSSEPAVLSQRATLHSEDPEALELPIASRSADILQDKGSASAASASVAPSEAGRGKFGEALDVMRGAAAATEKAVKKLCGSLINDFLFLRTLPGDASQCEPLQSHRKSDGLLNLARKALASQTLPMLVIAVTIQFTFYMSVAACLNAFAVVVSLMAFPHMSPLFWKALQRYNMIVIIAKMMYQFPLFPLPEALLKAEQTTVDVLDEGVPWVPVIGLMKVRGAADDVPLALTSSSLFGALWADLLVMFLLLAHWHALRHSGRMGDPTEICRYLTQDGQPPTGSDTDSSPASGEGPRALEIGPTLLLRRASSQLACSCGNVLMPDARFCRKCGKPRQELNNAPPLYPRADSHNLPDITGDYPAEDDEYEETISDIDSPSEVVSDEEQCFDATEYAFEASASDIHRVAGPVELAMEGVTVAVGLGHQLLEAGKNLAIGGAALRKPAMDLYLPRFVLSMILLLMLLVFWNKLQGSGSNFAEAVQSSVFSGTQVISVVVAITIIVVNRAEYAWYARHRKQAESTLSLSPRAGSGHLGSRSRTCRVSYNSRSRGSTLAISASSNAQPTTVQAPLGGFLIPVLQKVLLLFQLVALHAIYMQKWASQSVTNANPSMDNIYNVVFYMVYMAYLSLTSLQLKYDIHLVRGGLNLTHTTDIVSSLMFKAYIAIPFVEELRVLTDWTSTKTSLDFFMWMKLEDAQQSLYRVKRDMLVRAYVPATHPRDLFEKFYNGILLIGLLVLVIVAPLMFFSTLNPSLEARMVTSSSLLVTLHIVGNDGSTRSTDIYNARSTQILPDSTGTVEEESATRQTVRFSDQSDTFWVTPADFRSQVYEMLDATGSSVNLEFKLQTFANVTQSTGATTVSEKTWKSQQFRNNSATFDAIAAVLLSLNSTIDEFEEFDVTVPGAFLPQITVGSTGQVVGELDDATAENVVLKFDRPSDRDKPVLASLPYWSMEVAQSRPSIRVKSERVAPTLFGSTSSGSLIIAIYGGVILTLGKFLRMVFQDRSKFIMYEELPDAQLLLDLCNGIYIARIQGQLKVEYQLYYELIHLFRSPELLLDVSQKNGQHFAELP